MALLRPDAGGVLTENESIRESQNEATKVGGADTPVFDRSQDLRNFMYAVHRYGGGGWGGSKGGYMFQPGDWGNLSKGAGLTNARMADTAAQTYVAAYWMDNLYQRYRNWGLVAVAWKEGAGAANAIIKQARKEPAEITGADIEALSPGMMGFVGEVTKWSAWAQDKGGIPEDIDPNQSTQGRRILVGGGGTYTTITGSGYPTVEGPYAATIRQLYDESQTEKAARTPSGAEMLFAQLGSLSNVVTGGEGRVDWRHDPEGIEAGGRAELLGLIGEEEENEGEMT